MNRIARRSSITLILALVLIAGFTFFLVEYVAEAGQWATFPGSPHIYNAGNVGCGVVVDSEGTLLLNMNDGRQYSDSVALRKATVHWLGDINGSISAPALANYTAQISGYDLINGTYNYAGQSGIAELTLIAEAQTAALEAMGSYKGTAAVYNYKTGALLCCVTTPTFDPLNVPDIGTDGDEQYDGIYVNRFTQGSYTPGSIFKIVTLTAALETIPDITERSFTCKGTYIVDGTEVTCEERHGTQDLKQAFRNSCNCVFAEIAMELGAETLQSYVGRLGVTESVQMDGLTTASGNFEAVGAGQGDIAWSAIGQYRDQVNPCAFLSLVGAIANGGEGVYPHIVEKITVGGQTTYQAGTDTAGRIMRESTAQTVSEYMRNNVEDKYGNDSFAGLTACAKTGTGEVGNGKKPNAMLTGFTTDEEHPYAFIVCVENGGYGKTVCLPIISKILTACLKNDKTP